MNLFKSASKKLEIMGFSPNQSRWNGKVLMMLTGFGLNTVFNCIFLIREVNSFSELVNSIFLTTVTFEVYTCFIIVIVNLTKVFDLFKNAEQIVDLGKKK